MCNGRTCSCATGAHNVISLAIIASPCKGQEHAVCTLYCRRSAVCHQHARVGNYYTCMACSWSSSSKECMAALPQAQALVGSSRFILSMFWRVLARMLILSQAEPPRLSDPMRANVRAKRRTTSTPSADRSCLETSDITLNLHKFLLRPFYSCYAMTLPRCMSFCV